MRERLIELIAERLNSNIQILKCHNEKHIPVFHITDGRKHEIELIDEIYEDVSLILEKIKNNILIELPCKVEDKVYRTSGNYFGEKIFEGVVAQISIYNNGEIRFWEHGHPLSFTPNDFGKTVFLTREEAEQKLKEVKG